MAAGHKEPADNVEENDMTQVESMQTIAKRFRSEGKSIREATAEWTRQHREALRQHESELLEAARRPGGEHLRGVAEQILDHRRSGRRTTQG